MQPRMLPPQRLLLLLRPPKSSTRASGFQNARSFNYNSKRLFISPARARPQLQNPTAFNQLSSKKSSSVLNGRGSWQLSRSLTTASKNTLKGGLWLGTKYFVVFWTTVFLLSVVSFGFQHEHLERKYPTPPEWTWYSRWNYRYARSLEEEDEDSDKNPDESLAASTYANLLKRLESPDLDGKDLVVQGDGGILVPGVGSTGFDITNKSYPWRRSYFLTLMRTARIAEFLDGWVTDTTRDLNFPPQYMIGPSNPKPKPVPMGSDAPPLEENCAQAFPPPETFYIKVLTTKGFTTRERLEAALSYADWLDTKELGDSAAEMHKWGVDIATSDFDVPTSSIFDPTTGALLPNAPARYLTPNILLCATSIAVHHARNSDLPRALPVLASVLRARKALAPPPDTRQRSPNEDRDMISTLRRALIPPPYPPPPPPGDTPAHRTPSSICSEAGLMSHIGEVLFASSHLDDGLAWTRDAVDLAEAQLRDLVPDSAVQRDENTPVPPSYDLPDEGDGSAVERCKECLESGMHNWRMMVSSLAREEELRLEQRELEREKLLDDQQQHKAQSKGSIWSWLWPTGNQVADLGVAEGGDLTPLKGRWEAELEVVERRSSRVEVLLERERRRKKRENMSLVQTVVDQFPKLI
ncbi:MAG: hypothetical protein M4579_001736 [Chaenotheca gracillima]|nr:MAG: hypothetical protein M4579_001736 [Chaenotheca gracillima]